MRHLFATFLALLGVIAASCGGDTTRDDPWHCGESNDHAICRCTSPDRPLDAKLRPVPSCAKFNCCYAYENGDCFCLSDILGQPLQDCGLIQLSDGTRIDSCPQR